ncbi:Chromosome partitioning protein ParA [Pseudomonas fluorescens]|uniref:ParA family protein n=1 Tax=Pseudomonas fluorescens TaxID=294 RepID=UPI001241B664|nr:ParA family protein [Pseudomonas fluorescens]VVN27087.1 Chromosome partitioning protein ParA [Pseudomonas fluorescens]
MKIFAVANQKGGVGKTTTCINVALAATEAGLRVLIVDFDPMGNLSAVFRATGSHAGEASTASQMFTADAVIVPETLSPGFAIIRKDELMKQLPTNDSRLAAIPASNFRQLKNQFDLCIIDTPGALGDNVPTTSAALIAAHAVACPFGVGVLEADPFRELWAHLQKVIAGGVNPQLRVLGLIPSKVNPKSKTERKAIDDLRQHPAVKKYITPFTLFERASVKQSVSLRKPVWRGVRGAGHKTAADEWKVATQFILTQLEVLK